MRLFGRKKKQEKTKEPKIEKITEKELLSIKDEILKSLETAQEVPLIKKNKISDKELKSTKNVLLKTTETEIVLTPCRVNDDHTLAYEKDKKVKTIKIMPGRKAHTLVVPLHALLPSRIARLFAPRVLRFRTYTSQAEGEITHDPDQTHFNPELELRLETAIKLAATVAKANVADNLMAGMKGKKHWSEFIPYVVIAFIVFVFLFAFQIAPALN